MAWLLIPADIQRLPEIHARTDNVRSQLQKLNSTHSSLVFTYDKIAEDVAFVGSKNQLTKNTRATALADESDTDGSGDVHGDIAVVCPNCTLPDGYAELLWADCESIAMFLGPGFLVP